MSCLITNLPSYEVWVRKEYLTDHKSGHGEFVKGVWVSPKVYLVVPFILKLIYLSMQQCLISYQSLRFSRPQRYPILT